MDLLEIFDKEAKNKNILIIGDIMLDRYVWGDVVRISPEAPVPVVNVTRIESRLGGSANVALNIQSLGANPLLIGVIGNDASGNEFIKLMKSQKMNTEGLITTSDRQTITKTRIMGNSIQMLRVDEENNKNLPDALRQQVLLRITNLLEKYKIDAIVFQDYDKGVIDALLIKHIVQLAKTYNIPVCVDPKKRNFNNYNDVTLFKPNLKEFREGINWNDEIFNMNTLFDKIHQFREEKNIKYVMVTLGDKGLILAKTNTNNNLYSTINITPPKVRQVRDVSGAGDTVISVTTLGLAIGLDIEFVSELSNLAGGIVCEYVGVVPINKKQLIEEARIYLKNNDKKGI
ncbi:MAG TPA: bifunctional ADP-heptose synthase [Bacteroidales bacterium]|jgi:rfaE bifunctional protein kinase chain/domain|nr:bifunctional ADP-heptose synthase [Bacteroidales bacterium]HPX45323.1 bifunctional ADP-heptose synthase [Bacteroidales bacterium]HQC59404.1 bifunctional ADP-heptose synthase [Bacteroidales bacterium]HQM78556.1 bifunctional ADP-heptose synthase [Bacteroidales bacterium]